MILPTSSRSSDLTGEQGTDSNVKVVVRIRPENEREVAQQHTVVVHAVNEHVLAFDPADDHCSNAGSHMGRKFNRWDITKKRNKDLSFAFDHVFGPTANNIDLYEHTTKTVLDGLLNGYNCSVFAYGATGAGKTYTMLGTSKQPGITFLMLMDLYKRIDALKEDKLCNIAVSYLEVYNEQIRDLLMNSGSLPIREDPKSGAVISGLTLHQPKNAEELLQMLHHGNQNRSQHPTDANAESSRSHAVFQVFVKQCDRTANLVTNVRVAKLCLIDLAGSERATVTSNKGTRFREGANINQSLLALGNVINALADRKSKVHIPYRNSKLTRLLKDSLGGNCRTVMIATVSPSSGSYEDTYNTLKYADRAKNIKANLKRNVLSVKSHFSRYGKIVEDLRLEVQGLKEKLQQCESGALVPGCHVQPDEEVMRCQHLPARAGEVGVHFTDSFVELKRKTDFLLQEELHNIFMSRSSLRKEILEYESAQRGMEWKILCKRKHLARIGGCFLEQESGASEKKRVCEGIEMMWSRIASVHRRKEASLQRFEENENCLKRLKSEMVFAGNSDDGKMPELLEISLHARHLEVEVGDLRRHNKHLKTVVQAQERENQTNDRLVLEVLCTMKKFFFVMKGNNLLTSDLKDDCLRIQKLVQGRKEVMWADQAEPHTDPEVEENKKILDSIISFPMLKKLNITPTLSNSVKHRRESLTPLLNSTRSLMEMAEDEKQMIESPENEVRHKTHQLTPCIARGSKRWCIGSLNDSLLKSALGSSLAASEESPGPLNRSAERLKSLPQLPEASVEKPPGVCESSLSRTFLCPSHEKPVGKINENCDEAVKGNLVRAIHLNSEESPKSGLSFADVVKSSFRSPLLTINNHLSPSTQPVTPQAAPSTRDLASKPIFISGSTVTKSQVTLPRTKPSEHFQTASNFSLKSIHKLRPQTIDGNVTSGSKNSSKLNNKTGYLRMTHAASVRSHDTVRSKFQKPLLKTDKNSFCRQQKTKVHFQSKSASNLNKVVRLL